MYDLIIIWAWSAWYPAWMYASRYWLKNLIIWKMPGGALSTSHKVENYPWTISAPWREIMKNFKEQTELSGSEIIFKEVSTIIKTENWFDVVLSNWTTYQTKYVIIATWNTYKKLWLPSEVEFFWRWVSYCATCDWTFFRGRDIAVVWWWNTALTDALYLSDLCKTVYLIHRRQDFRAEEIWVNQVKEKNNIILLLEDEILELQGKDFLEKAILKSWKVIDIEWLFVAIWSLPNTNLVKHLNLEKDDEGCLVVDKRQETNLKWLYAAWDITTNSNKFKQTIMSAAEWCLAANSVHEDYLIHKNK